MNLALLTSLVHPGPKGAAPAGASKVTESPSGFEVDTGPPDPGAPPPIGAAATQKEVEANEPKPQAQILDLLEKILPVDLTTFATKGAKSNATAELGIHIGDLKASIKSDPLSINLAQLLQALGIKLPTNLQVTDLAALKKQIADKIVSLDLPTNVRGLLSTVLAAAQDTLQAQQAAQLGVAPSDAEYVFVANSVGTTPISGQQPAFIAHKESSIPLSGSKLDNAPVGAAAHVPVLSTGRAPQAIDNGIVGPPVHTPMLSTGRPSQAIDNGIVGPPVHTPMLSTGRPPQAIDNGIIGPPVHTPMLSTGRPPQPIGTTMIGPVVSVSLGDTKPVGGAEGVKLAPPDIKTSGVSLEKQVVEGLKVSAVSTVPEKGSVSTSPILNTVVAAQQSSQEAVAADLPVQVIDKKTATGQETTIAPQEPTTGVTKSASAQAVAAEASPLNKKPTEKPIEQKADTATDESDEKSTLTSDQAKPDVATAVAKLTTARVHGTDSKNSAAMITSAHRTEIVTQIVDQIQQMAAAQGNGRTTIKLNPDNLGTITLVIKTFGDNVEAKLTASDDHVRVALSQHRTDLVQSVQSRGLTLNHLSVGHEGGHDAWAGFQHSGNSDNGGQSQTTRQDFERSTALWSGRADASLLSTAPAASYAGRIQGLDTLA